MPFGAQDKGSPCFCALMTQLPSVLRFVTEVVNPCLEDVHCEQLPLDSPFMECLKSQGHAASFSEGLIGAINLGRYILLLFWILKGFHLKYN